MERYRSPARYLRVSLTPDTERVDEQRSNQTKRSNGRRQWMRSGRDRKEKRVECRLFMLTRQAHVDSNQRRRSATCLMARPLTSQGTTNMTCQSNLSRRMDSKRNYRSCRLIAAVRESKCGSDHCRQLKLRALGGPDSCAVSVEYHILEHGVRDGPQCQGIHLRLARHENVWDEIPLSPFA